MRLNLFNEKDIIINFCSYLCSCSITEYPKSEEAPIAQFQLGLCYLKLKNIEKAIEEFQKVIDNYPDSPYAEQARFKIKLIRVVKK